ncbi:unnamed protein product [Durusdinium trenchii]|uniref:Calcineurin-like phosphoesterase domain-containing protein n=1 Tax=Durusdinium trenchii TaxID=1381693 RepID=A0ABP0RNP6_9DINO
MADIGHSRDHADQLTRPWPMGKCAYEGAFSLYEGLEDFVQNRGAKPTAALIVGDVAYGGGDPEVCNATRNAFQKYLHGQVPVDRVFPVMGNHDIHYLGCSRGEMLTPWLPCYYGTAHTSVMSNYQMTFWLDIPDIPRSKKSVLDADGNGSKNDPPSPLDTGHDVMPGTASAASLPRHVPAMVVPPAGPRRFGRSCPRFPAAIEASTEVRVRSVAQLCGLTEGSCESAVSRQLRSTSSLGLFQVAMDAMGPNGDELECRFLRDSLAEGRRLKKSIFVYVTHDFQHACKDWSLISAIDVWITGHKHLYWQSEASGSTQAQELRHFPLRILIGNGGFDEGQMDVVSFGHLREIPYDAGGQQRVKVQFKIYDTCISDDFMCPMIGKGGPYCWDKCRSIPGGVDRGGGSRKATPGAMGGFDREERRGVKHGVGGLRR